MSKIAFVFPGQGAQYLGMGKEIIENFEESKEVFEKAKEILDFDLEEVCFKSEEKITNTEFTQAALLTISIAILKAVEKLGIYPDYLAGLSLGEYTALVGNGAMDFADGLLLVRKRGIYMEEAAKSTKGTMAAVIGSDASTINEVCSKVPGIVGIANYNSKSQLVIAGEYEAVEDASRRLIEMGIKLIPLKVSGAFHSPLMESAGVKLEKALDKVQIKSFNIPYVTNVTGKIVEDKDSIKDLLIKQLTSPVKWEDCVKTLIDQGVETFIEIGPSKTLSGLIKKIDRNKKVYNIEDLKSFDKLKEALEV